MLLAGSLGLLFPLLCISKKTISLTALLSHTITATISLTSASLPFHIAHLFTVVLHTILLQQRRKQSYFGLHLTLRYEDLRLESLILSL